MFGGALPLSTSAWRATEVLSPPSYDSKKFVIASLEEAGCTFEIVRAMITIRANADVPPTVSGQDVVFLRKRDTVPGSCAEPKGSTGELPGGGRYDSFLAVVGRHPTEGFLVIAYGGRTINGIRPGTVMQVDGVTGRPIHTAVGTASAALTPGFGLAPLSFDMAGCDLTVHWSGRTATASGAQTNHVVGTYPHFLAPQLQADSVPATLAYE